ncbi:hypothetical protein BGZ73_008528 [Actinomortierella ambigua]|nr:hypothetical protein BGZ73_008528 [Actinomortierella ambigua]
MTLHRTASATLPTPLSSIKGGYSSNHAGKGPSSRPTSPVLPSPLYSSSSDSSIGSPTASPRLACSHAHAHAPLSSVMLSPVDHPPLRLLTAASCLESFTTLVSAQSPPHSPTFPALNFHSITASPVLTSSAVSAASIPSAPSSRASSIMDGIQTAMLGGGQGASTTPPSWQSNAALHPPQHSAAKESLSRVHRAHQQHQQRLTTSRNGLEAGASRQEEEDEKSTPAMPRSRSDYFSFPSFEDVDFVYVAMEEANEEEDQEKTKKKGEQEEEDDAHAEEDRRAKKKVKGIDEKHGPWKAQNHALQLDHFYDAQQQQQRHPQPHGMGYVEQRRHSDHHLTDRGRYSTATCQPLPNYEQLQQQMQQRRKSSYPSMGYYYPPPVPMDAYHVQHPQQ